MSQIKISQLDEVSSLGPDDMLVVVTVDGETLTTRRVKNSNLVPFGVVLDHGDQDISGVKTFSSFPVLPSGVSPSGRQAATADYVDEQVGGGWVDVGTIYAIKA